MSKIEKLTSKQEKEMIAFREEWRKIGTSTERIDKETTKEAITEMYKSLGKTEPKFIFVPSPFFANLQINFCSKILFPKIKESLGESANLGDNLGDNLWDNLGANLRANLEANLEDNLRVNLWDNLWDNLRDNLGDNLRDNLGDNLRANLRDNLGANLWANLWANLETNLWANLRANLWANLRDNLRDKTLPKELQEIHYTYFWGQMDSSWIAFYKFPELKLGIQYAKDKSHLLELWAKIAKSACWWWAFENYVFVSDRPTKLSFDERYRLHSLTKPAYEFSDGFKAYYINGVKFDEDLWTKVTKDQLSAKQVFEIENTEQRRVAYELMDKKKMLALDDYKVLDEVKDDGYGYPMKIISFNVKGFNKPFIYYHCFCPTTGREYFLQTDKKTCVAAKESSFGLNNVKWVAEY